MSFPTSRVGWAWDAMAVLDSEVERLALTSRGGPELLQAFFGFLPITRLNVRWLTLAEILEDVGLQCGRKVTKMVLLQAAYEFAIGSISQHVLA